MKAGCQKAKYEVIVSFSGRVTFEIETDDEDKAVAEAKDSFHRHSWHPEGAKYCVLRTADVSDVFRYSLAEVRDEE